MRWAARKKMFSVNKKINDKERAVLTLDGHGK